MNVDRVEDLPSVPAVYAIIDGKWTAYVGSAGDVKRRVRQHLVLRNTSVTTGAAAVTLNPDLVTEVRWWEDERFADENILQAAEMIASVVLRPTLRARSKTPLAAVALSRDDEFSAALVRTFEGVPTGTLPLLPRAALSTRVQELERRMLELEGRP